MFDQRNDAEPKSYVVFAAGRILPAAVVLPVIVGDNNTGCLIVVLAGSVVIACVVLKPKCLTWTLAPAAGLEVKVIVLPVVV